MKSFVVFALFIAAALAAPATVDSNAETLKYNNNNIGVEGYNYNVETSNGIKVDEAAGFQNQGTDAETYEVRGTFSYPGPDGVIYTVTYVANDKGFQASGAHLPSPPQ